MCWVFIAPVDNLYILKRGKNIQTIPSLAVLGIEMVKEGVLSEPLKVCGCLCIQERNSRAKKGAIISVGKLADKLLTPLY